MLELPLTLSPPLLILELLLLLLLLLKRSAGDARPLGCHGNVAAGLIPAGPSTSAAATAAAAGCCGCCCCCSCCCCCCGCCCVSVLTSWLTRVSTLLLPAVAPTAFSSAACNKPLLDPPGGVGFSRLGLTKRQDVQPLLTCVHCVRPCCCLLLPPPPLALAAETTAAEPHSSSSSSHLPGGDLDLVCLCLIHASAASCCGWSLLQPQATHQRQQQQ